MDKQSTIFNDEEINHLVTQTPFHIENNWEFTVENRNKNCSHAEIENLLQKRILNLIDIEIIRISACYHYLNSNNFCFLLNSRLHPAYQKQNYLRNLNKLMRAGILIRYYLFNNTISPLESLSKEPISPLKLYCLSQSGYTYIESQIENVQAPVAASTLRKLELVALNQFLIRFQYNYKTKILSTLYLKKTKIGSTPFTIDAIIRYQTEHPTLRHSDIISLFLFSVREHENWVNDIIKRLQLFSVWMQRHEEYHIPFVIIIVENISMMSTIFVQVQNTPSLSNLSFYFCPDSLLMVYPPLDTIYSCEITDSEHIKVVRRSFNI